MDSAQDLFKPVPTPAEFQTPAGDRFFISEDGNRAMISSEEGVQATFFEKSYKKELASQAAGIPIYETKTYVRVKTKFDPKNIHEHPVREKGECEWKTRFAFEWDLYQKSKAHAAQGFPVMNWDEVEPHQKATLVAIGIITIEQLVVAEDAVLLKVFSNPKKIKEAGLAQLNFKNKIAEITEVTKKLVATEGQLDSANDIIDRLRAEKETLQAALNAVKGKAAPVQDKEARQFLKQAAEKRAEDKGE